MPSREDLHRLVASLPDDALLAAHVTLTHMQSWPPPELAQALEESEQFEQRMHDRVERLRDRHPHAGGIGGGSFLIGPTSERRGRHSFGYEEGGESVHESDIVHDDCEFTLIERIRRDDVARTVIFTLELTGPDGTTTRHEHRYDLS